MRCWSCLFAIVLYIYFVGQPIDVQGIYKIDFKDLSKSQLYPWTSICKRIILFDRPYITPASDAEELNDADVDMFLNKLKNSVKKRTTQIAGNGQVAILFSGGIDSVIITALAHLYVKWISNWLEWWIRITL